MKHILKCDKSAFVAIVRGKKKAEFRYNDRNYKRGDILEMFEMENRKPTGKLLVAYVSHIQQGYGIPENYVMLSLGYVSKAHLMSKEKCMERLGMPIKEEKSYSEELADA